MTSCKRSMFLTAGALALGLLATPWPSTALPLLIIREDSGPNIKQELFRADGNFPSIWDSAQGLSFSFPVPVTAAGDGLFRMFAGGDLNNLSIDRIDVTTGPFGSRTLLGTFAFPIGDVHFTGCEAPSPRQPVTMPSSRDRTRRQAPQPCRGPGGGRGRRAQEHYVIQRWNAGTGRAAVLPRRWHNAHTGPVSEKRDLRPLHRQARGLVSVHAGHTGTGA